jgi:hypothetical protein
MRAGARADGYAMGDRLTGLREAQNRNRQTHTREVDQRRLLIGVVLALLALALLWMTGRLDPVLGAVGLHQNGVARPQQNQTGTGGPGGIPAATNVAQANLRAAAPAVQAYFANNGTYVGMEDPGRGLAAIDPASAATVTVVSTAATSYCIQTTVGTKTFSQRGPTGAIAPGPC